MKSIVKKIAGGKLVKIEYELDPITSKLVYFKLYGDFFLYPEYLLLTIEKNLIGVGIVDIATTIQKILDNASGEFIGVSSIDIQNILLEVES